MVSYAFAWQIFSTHKLIFLRGVHDWLCSRSCWTHKLNRDEMIWLAEYSFTVKEQHHRRLKEDKWCHTNVNMWTNIFWINMKIDFKILIVAYNKYFTEAARKMWRNVHIWHIVKLNRSTFLNNIYLRFEMTRTAVYIMIK